PRKTTVTSRTSSSGLVYMKGAWHTCPLNIGLSQVDLVVRQAPEDQARRPGRLAKTVTQTARRKPLELPPVRAALQGLLAHFAEAAPLSHRRADWLLTGNGHSARLQNGAASGLHMANSQGISAGGLPRPQKWRCCHLPDWKRTPGHQL